MKLEFQKKKRENKAEEISEEIGETFFTKPSTELDFS